MTVARNGGVDIGNNRLMIDYGSNYDPADPIATIAAYIKDGFNNGAWNGTSGGGGDTFNGGIFSSAAAANSKSYGIGYADSADAGNPAGLPSGTIEMMYTLLGDANLDGKVNGTDFAILATHLNEAVSGWDEGDFNYDGAVNGSDFADLAANFNHGASEADVAALEAFAAAHGMSADLPEPWAWPTVAAGVGGVFAGRRGRRRERSEEGRRETGRRRDGETERRRDEVKEVPKR